MATIPDFNDRVVDAIFSTNALELIQTVKFPEQIIQTLAGQDVVLLPPPAEITEPFDAEQFTVDFLEILMEAPYNLRFVVDSNQDPNLRFALQTLLPEFFPQDLVVQYAEAMRLPEYVNGLGNGVKPEAPTEMVRVLGADGSPIRDILTDSPEQTQRAIDRNSGGNYNIQVVPANDANLATALNSRSGAETIPSSSNQFESQVSEVIPQALPGVGQVLPSAGDVLLAQ